LSIRKVSPAAPPRPTAHAQSEPLAVSGRLTVALMSLVVLLAAGLLAKQIAGAKIATRDATAFYLPLADAAAEGDYAEAQHPIIPPVYPMLVGLTARLCWWADRPTELVGRLGSAVAVLGLTVCVFFLGRSAAHPRVGLVAAALTATNPRIIRLGAAVGPAMLYALLLAVTALLLTGYRPRGRLITAGGIGLLAALAALTRSEGIFLIPLALAVMLIVHLAGPRPRRLGAGLLLATAVMAGVLWPRAAYLHRKTGYPVLDARMLRVLPLPGRPDDPALWRPPIQVNVVPRPAPTQRDFAGRLEEAKEGLLDVLSRPSWGR